MLIHLNCNSIINYTFQIFNGEFESELYLSLADINMDGVMPCAADNFAGAVINSAFDISILICELYGLLAAVKSCAKGLDSVVDIAEGADASCNGACGMGIGLGAVGLLLEVNCYFCNSTPRYRNGTYGIFCPKTTFAGDMA